jgi:hypothetical protein
MLVVEVVAQLMLRPPQQVVLAELVVAEEEVIQIKVPLTQLVEQ